MRHIHACMIVISIYLDISIDRKHIAISATINVHLFDITCL